MKEIPAISVIIPMYNAEKYISECLNSLLEQTFKNFEVIVVDDCSTDNSVEIVKNYAEKFNGRLKIMNLPTNSGTGGYLPRNRGFALSRGEYVFFVDSDDFITKTALQELYSAAKNSDADVVYIAARYQYKTDKNPEIKFDKIGKTLREKGIEDKITLEIDNPKKILQNLLIEDALHWEPWSKFVKRDFLIKNEINFAEILSGGDFVWTIELSCRTKRFLRFVNPVYFWRDDSKDSIIRKNRPIDKQINFWMSVIISGSIVLKNLSNKIELLNQNPIYCYRGINLWFNWCFNSRCFNERMKIRSEEFYEILRREFAKNDNDFGLTIPFLCSIIDRQQKNLMVTQQRFNNFAKQAQKRIAELENELNKIKN